MKKFFTLFSILFAFIVMAGVVSAQTSNITFPIAQLGNCSSVADCKTYCDDPTHLDSCIAFAKEKGFYKETSLDSQKEAILEDAKTTLGCDSLDSCKIFCQNSANASACSDFAKKHSLKGGNSQIDNVTLDKAKTELGCDNAASCMALCDQEENKAKCASFAKENGLRGGHETNGPGGCTSESSCKTFCSNPNNFQVCSSFVKDHEGSESGKRTFTGPGGCTSEDSCRAYCQKNPTICHLPSTEKETGDRPDVLSGTPVPTNMSRDDFCHLHPDACPTPSDTRQITPNITESQSLDCQTKGPGCFFNGANCVCPSPTPNGTSGSGSNTSGSPTPTKSETPTPTGTVQGAATHISFFDWLIERLLHIN